MISIDTSLIKEMVESGKRLDNRKFDEYRKITVEPGVISQAEGSSRVRMGNTEVVAGIKLDIGEPYPDTPDEGVLAVSAELVPLAFEEFEAGPPGEESIELARVVDRVIRESKAIDMKKLCIKKGEKVWAIFVDIDVLDHDGNLIDAATLAAISALLNTRMLKLEDDKPNYEEKTNEKLPITRKPINTTFVKIDDQIMIDPLIQEEEAMDARLTIGAFFDETKGKSNFCLCSMQKGGSAGFTIEEINKIIDMTEKKSEELRKLLK